MTAKIVIPSAKRLIDVRQPCLRSSRIAEISVPAWPIPIHHTKLMIAKPQPTGWLTPQMPVPLISSHVTAMPSMPINMKPIDTTMNQLRGVRPPRTTPLILSVIEPKVWPGSMSGGGAYVAGFGLIIVQPRGFAVRVDWSSSDQLRIRVAQRGQVSSARARVEILEQAVVAFQLLQPGDAAFRIVQVAEYDGVGRTRRGARGDDFPVLDPAVVPLGVLPRVVDPLHAVGALLHHAAAAHGDVRIAQRLQTWCFPVLIEQEIEPAHLVGAVVRAVPRPDAAVVDHVVQHLQ